MGIIPAAMVPGPRNPDIKPWAGLPAEEKRTESRKMEIYAAMVENLDAHIGELIRFLKESDLLENTLIVFMSDNGAAGEDFYNLPKGQGPYLRAHYANSYENMGKAGSFVSYGPQWAQAGAAPFKLYKSYAAEGGVVCPLIIAGKSVDRKPGIQNTFINVMDLAPGFLELAKLSYPSNYHNKKMVPMMGESFLPYVKGENYSIHNDQYVFAIEHDGQCLLIKGDWKITNISEPFDEHAFSLYNLIDDMGETHDLSKSNPEKYKEMLDEWEIFKKKTGVIPKQQGE
jgi:arylsulfatase